MFPAPLVGAVNTQFGDPSGIRPIGKSAAWMPKLIESRSRPPLADLSKKNTWSPDFFKENPVLSGETGSPLLQRTVMNPFAAIMEDGGMTHLRGRSTLSVRVVSE